MSATVHPTTPCTPPAPRAPIGDDPATGDYARPLDGAPIGAAATEHAAVYRIDPAADQFRPAPCRQEARP